RRLRYARRPTRACGIDSRGAQTLARCAQPCGGSDASEAEHLLQTVKPRRPADHPARRLHRTLCVNRPARRPMDHLEPLAGSGKDHMVVADRIAAAQRRKADVTRAAGASDAVPPALLYFFKGHLT